MAHKIVQPGGERLLSETLLGSVHKVLTRTTYIGCHRFNTKFWKTREHKLATDVVVEMAVPAIIDAAEFNAVQTLLRTRSPALTAPRVVSGPTLLIGICFCAACGKAMTLRTEGGKVPLLHLLNQGPPKRRLLQPAHLEKILSSVLDRRRTR